MSRRSKGLSTNEIALFFDRDDGLQWPGSDEDEEEEEDEEPHRVVDVLIESEVGESDNVFRPLITVNGCQYFVLLVILLRKI